MGVWIPCPNDLEGWFWSSSTQAIIRWPLLYIGQNPNDNEWYHFLNQVYSFGYNPLTISCVTLALSRLVGSIEAIKQPTNRVVPADPPQLQVVELLFLGIFVGEENASEVFWVIVVGWWRGWGLDVGRCSCRGWGSMKKAFSCKNLFWVHSEGQWTKTAVNPKV